MDNQKEQSTFVEQYMAELARLQELLAEYKSLPDGAGFFGIGIIQGEIKQATQALTEDNVVKMLKCFESMKGCE